MSQNPTSNPFGSGPAGNPGGAPEAQNPFQIVGGGDKPASSPFEAVGDQAESAPAGQPAPPAGNPFQVAGDRPAATQGGGFPIKGFRTGPAPVDQLEAAPVQGNAEEGQGEEAPLNVDPFAGMDLPQVSDQAAETTAVAEAPAETSEAADFSAPAPEPEAASEPEAEREPAPAPEPVAAAPEPEPVASTPEPEPEPQRESKRQKPAREVSLSRPAASSSVTSETKQLELRAIFGVDHELSRQEILQRARGLPGVLHVCKVNAKEADALNTLQGCASKLGLDDDEPVVLSCPEGFIDFLTYDGTSLGILREEDYAPGVRETLLICARELDKL